MCDGGGGDCGGGDGGGDMGFDSNPGWSGGNGHHYDDNYAGGTNHYSSKTNRYKSNNNRSGSFFSKVPFSVSVFFFAFPMLISFGVGAYLLIDVMGDVNSWASIDGTIIDITSCGCTSSGTNTGCTTTFKPVIQYFVDGMAYQFESSTCSNPTIGNSIKVLYDPNNPGDARDGSFTSLWLGPIIALAIGIAASGMLVYNIRKYLHERKEQQQQQTNMNWNTSDAIHGSNYTNSAVGGHSNGVTTSDPMVSLAEPSAPEFSTSIPYAETVTETNNDENKKPSLFDQLQANSKY